MSNFAPLESALGYHFTNQNLLQEALNHKSCANTKNNERLEFLGDAVLDLLVGEYLFCKFVHFDEGRLSKMRASLVNEKSFASFARHLGIADFLVLSMSEEQNNGRQKDSLLSNAFEAIIGAVYLESGIDKVREIIQKILERFYPNMRFENLLTDYKTALQELTQERFGVLPIYELLHQKGPDHKKEFFTQVCIHNTIYAKAYGNSKKSAEQACAKLAYQVLTNEQNTKNKSQKNSKQDKHNKHKKDDNKDNKSKDFDKKSKSNQKSSLKSSEKSAKKSHKKAQK